MFDFCYIHRRLPPKIFLASFVAFIFLNVIENFIHYNVGRNHEEREFLKISMPSAKDWMKIVIIMIVFAILQGGFTLLLSNYL